MFGIISAGYRAAAKYYKNLAANNCKAVLKRHATIQTVKLGENVCVQTESEPEKTDVAVQTKHPEKAEFGAQMGSFLQHKEIGVQTLDILKKDVTVQTEKSEKEVAIQTEVGRRSRLECGVAVKTSDVIEDVKDDSVDESDGSLLESKKLAYHVILVMYSCHAC